MKRPSTKDAAIALIPFFYGVTIAVMVLLTLIKSKATKELADIWKYLAGIASFFLVLGVTYVYIVPQLREEVENAEQTLAEQGPSRQLPPVMVWALDYYHGLVSMTSAALVAWSSAQPSPTRRSRSRQ